MNNINQIFQNQPQKLSKYEIKTLQFILKYFHGKCEQFQKVTIDQISTEINTDRSYAAKLLRRMKSKGILSRRGHRICIHLDAARAAITTSTKCGTFYNKTNSKVPHLKQPPIININHVYKYTNQVFSYKKNQSCSQQKPKRSPNGPIDFKFYLKKHWEVGLKYISAVADTSKIKDLDAYNASVLKTWYKSPEIKNKALAKMNQLKKAAEEKQRRQEVQKNQTTTIIIQRQNDRKNTTSRKTKIDDLKKSGFYDTHKARAVEELAFEMKIAQTNVLPMFIDAKIIEFANNKYNL